MFGSLWPSNQSDFVLSKYFLYLCTCVCVCVQKCDEFTSEYRNFFFHFPEIDINVQNVRGISPRNAISNVIAENGIQGGGSHVNHAAKNLREITLRLHSKLFVAEIQTCVRKRIEIRNGFYCQPITKPMPEMQINWNYWTRVKTMTSMAMDILKIARMTWLSQWVMPLAMMTASLHLKHHWNSPCFVICAVHNSNIPKTTFA